MHFEIIKEKRCGNCKNYLKLYIKLKTSYQPMTGYCVLPALLENHVTHKSELFDCCQNWEKIEEEKHDSIGIVLGKISEQLFDILSILKDEDK